MPDLQAPLLPKTCRPCSCHHGRLGPVPAPSANSCKINWNALQPSTCGQSQVPWTFEICLDALSNPLACPCRLMLAAAQKQLKMCLLSHIINLPASVKTCQVSYRNNKAALKTCYMLHVADQCEGPEILWDCAGTLAVWSAQRASRVWLLAQRLVQPIDQLGSGKPSCSRLHLWRCSVQQFCFKTDDKPSRGVCGFWNELHYHSPPGEQQWNFRQLAAGGTGCAIRYAIEGKQPWA